MSAIHLLDDDQLAGLLRDGNELAFTEIYNRYWDKLYYTAYKLLKDTDAAEEIVQDVFFILWKKRETLAIKSLAAYLASMTRYAVYRLISKEKNIKKQENIAGLLGVAAMSEMNVDNKILLEIITLLSNKLPEKCRLVFQYNKLQDRSLADVAVQLNMSRKTAEGHLTKALKIIRTSMGNFMALLF
ncbi:sigma-70 family RNA polymerase sigma factor [Mucilaginibacter sp.]|uniref:sigma-70 family RNA polymerase sigma factor n=1 Tax=Mucilaginibacter sp. TaxID=1882438 RepID=UPI0026325BCB|nr:sigma-70 family RNA polymerase sigma factor [Mucilaginibacter sp.]MDB5029365.1 polymerase subunit sigma-24 [Mucilaginibacter sp.]